MVETPGQRRGRSRPGDTPGIVQVAAAALLAALASGCGGDQPEHGVVVDTLPGGAIRVSSPADGLWGDRERWRFSEEVRIGTATGGGAAAFGDLRGLAVDRLGRIWVADIDAKEVRVFDGEGSFVRSVGREGEGPGEFQYPNGLAAGPEGRIHVFDPRTQRITVFDTAGRHLTDRRRTTGGYGFLWRGGFTRDGRLFDYRVGVGIVVLGPDLTVRDTIEAPRGQGEPPYFYGPNRQGGQTAMAVPYLGRPTWEVGPEGMIWYAPGRPYRLYRLTPELDTSRVVERDHRPVAVTEAERDSAEKGVRERYAPGADLDLSRIPETKPAVQEVFFDDRGNLWARPYLPGDSTGYALDVFDRRGRYLGRVRSPVKLRRWPEPVVRDGRLHGVTVDELDVPYVVRLHIEKPGNRVGS